MARHIKAYYIHCLESQACIYTTIVWTYNISNCQYKRFTLTSGQRSILTNSPIAGPRISPASWPKRLWLRINSRKNLFCWNSEYLIKCVACTTNVWDNSAEHIHLMGISADRTGVEFVAVYYIHYNTFLIFTHGLWNTNVFNKQQCKLMIKSFLPPKRQPVIRHLYQTVHYL